MASVGISSTKRLCHTIFICLLTVACQTAQKPFVYPPPSPIQLIEQRGELRVCTYHNTTDYYVYKGVTKGFHYELLKHFSDYLGVKLCVETSTHFEQTLEELNEGKYDLVAMNLVVTDNRLERVQFSDPLFYTRRVLVQNSEATDKIDSLHQLEGKTICIQAGTSSKHFLEQLRDSLKISFDINELDGVTYEDILLMVEHQEIDFTVTEQHLAHIASQYMPRINCEIVLSEEIPVAWAIPKEARYLVKEVNQWLASIKGNGIFQVLYKRYFKNSYTTSLYNSKYYKLKKGEISPFDSIFKHQANRIGWDWRLLAALAYHESGFNAGITSPSGAAGLMQLMPVTALNFGIKNFWDPRENIYAGISYLKYLDSFFDSSRFEPGERILFILAAYNAGPGHVLDAMRLTEAHQKNPYVWNKNVEHYLYCKSQPEYYRDSVVRYGYCDGKQSCDFVNNIIETYTHYKNTIPE